MERQRRWPLSRPLEPAFPARHAAVCVGSTLFPGLTELIDALDNHGTPRGVITNKPQRMTEPLLRKPGLGDRVCCTVSGDTRERAGIILEAIKA